MRSPVWQYPGVITSQGLSTSQVDTSCANTVAISTETMSNGSATPPNITNNGDHIHITTMAGDATKFLFPAGANSIPISPGLFGTPFFTQNGTNIPITPTLLTQAVSFNEPYMKQGHIYSPFTLAQHTGLTGGLPRTPTLPPPSPHAIASSGFPLTAITNHQGLPTSAATLVGSPFTRAGSFLDDIAKIGSISPFIVSPSLSPNRKPNGTTIFFPTTITASGEAKLTISGSADRLSNTPDGSINSTDSPLIKREGTPQTCYIGGGDDGN